MSEREEFEKWYENQYAGYGYNEALATFERQQKKIDALKALNPDVPCPVCGGKGGWYNKTAIPEYVSCYLCNSTGAIPLTKAQEYRIKELEGQIKAMQESAQKCIETLGGEA